MKQCSNCNKIYGDSDYYCLICNYRLNTIDIAKVSEDEISSILRHEKAIRNPNKINKTNSNIPKCPVCGSINIIKITASSKIGKFVMLGLLSIGSIGKTYKCQNCDMKF